MANNDDDYDDDEWYNNNKNNNNSLFETANSLETLDFWLFNQETGIKLLAEHEKLLFAPTQTDRLSVCPHPASYLMGKGGSFRGVKAAWA
jgi:hypothetical protein